MALCVIMGGSIAQQFATLLLLLLLLSVRA
jgi:hypothetical protein